MELERVVPKLLSQLVGGRLNPTQHLETQQALVKQLAEILEFVLKFDEFKVRRVGSDGVPYHIYDVANGFKFPKINFILRSPIFGR